MTHRSDGSAIEPSNTIYTSNQEVCEITSSDVLMAACSACCSWIRSTAAVSRLRARPRRGVDEVLGDGDTLLSTACEVGHRECTRLLLITGADVNLATDIGCTPLFVACEQGHLDCARLMLDAGAATDQARQDEVTPLLIACQNGHIDCVRLLLEAGAAIDQATNVDTTPLYIACQKGHANCVRLLLEAGAIGHARQGGSSPLNIACQEGHLDCARLMINAGATIDQARQDEVTPLFIACQECHIDCVRLLLEAGADANRAANSGATPLLIACEQGHDDCARLLLDAGAAVHKADEDGVTPIYIASQGGHHVCAQLLLAYGASGGAVDTDGFSRAERYARDSGQIEMLSWLKHTRLWMPQHHLVQFGLHRLRALLRAGIDLHDKPLSGQPHVPSLLDRAKELRLTAAGQMVLRAAEPWSPANHELFPDATRARAWELLRLGRLLAGAPRFVGHAVALGDVWLGTVLPHVLSRKIL